jgi:hypothetical protein
MATMTSSRSPLSISYSSSSSSMSLSSSPPPPPPPPASSHDANDHNERQRKLHMLKEVRTIFFCNVEYKQTNSIVGRQYSFESILYFQKAERLFGYSLSTPNLRVAQNRWSSSAPSLTPPHQQKPSRKVKEEYCLPVIIFELNWSSPQALPQALSPLLHQRPEEQEHENMDHSVTHQH